MKPQYDQKFFAEQAAGSYRSAQIVLPLVFDLLKPASVVDFGCGVGPWLKAAADLGVTDVLGIDGDYVDRSQLMISADRFLSRDLTQSVQIDRRFDLAISLEVAEHLPGAAAFDFVESLTRLADVVLFSAAFPAQGGVGHVNENWLEYWALRFAKRGYLPVDAIRPRIWNKRFVEPWYRMNMLVFATPDAVARHGLQASVVQPSELMSLIHPHFFMLVLGMNKVVPFGPQHLDRYYELVRDAATQMRAVPGSARPD